jgi:hypothetical protein
MRELLKEAAEVLRRGQADEQAILAKHIGDVLAELEPDAMEIVLKVREGSVAGHTLSSNYWKLTDSEAAALIADYRRVPRAMLDEIWLNGYQCKDGKKDTDMAEIADKHDYKVEG